MSTNILSRGLISISLLVFVLLIMSKNSNLYLHKICRSYPLDFIQIKFQKHESCRIPSTMIHKCVDKSIWISVLQLSRMRSRHERESIFLDKSLNNRRYSLESILSIFDLNRTRIVILSSGYLFQ